MPTPNQESMKFRISAADARARLEVARNIVRETISGLDLVSSHAADKAARAADSLKYAIEDVDRQVARHEG
jgi:hypothetical protein